MGKRTTQNDNRPTMTTVDNHRQGVARAANCCLLGCIREGFDAVTALADVGQ